MCLRPLYSYWIAELLHHSNINDRNTSAFYMNRPGSKLVHTVVEYKRVYRLIMFAKFCLFYSVSRQFDLKLITLEFNFPALICVLIYK